ncbi:threonine--tRNA ligase [Alterisphingorhabdus coralli]|uniref:Threonine--tRNA ligase n=1 Tax=Alterisphingorhabdus coralli TaxID=3071408 RepID=A0AA97I102_9SPHN|nr:threonine--tRNA ligase [Parasphingorhabdus sp. SCSIO 66989]WOE75542.1 threonine--tRNA ligase [Parasphingorhabdus sp. SCSIO 66989]
MTKMIKITLPDGSAREVASGTTPAEIAADIGPGLAKAAMAARIDGEVRDIMRPLDNDTDLALITNRDEEDALELVRHDYAHVLAEAVQALWPGTQITFGPATEDGFYYDVMAPASREPFSLDDLPAIEEKMREIIKADKPLVREVWSRQQLIDKWEKEGETFKAEWAKELPEDEELTVYWSGEPGSEGAWLDMCRGPHLASTGKLDPQAFKLMRVAGAYWRGDQKNAQLTRIYGTGWLNKKQLNAHLHRLEEAAKRDHRKLGRELDLFHFEEFGPGAVFWHPHGWQMFQNLLTYMRRRQERAGYVEVNTPDVMDRSLWETSGHWFNYHEHMFTTQTEDSRVFALKPMNCPGGVSLFAHGLKSYRDLPLRMAEFGKVHRYEPSGALHGLMRVRHFTQDDAHIFCTPDQLNDENRAVVELVLDIYREFGFDDVRIKLSTRPENRMGSDEVWDVLEGSLIDTLDAMGLEYSINEGEGAFYGPKLEFVLRDAIGRDWQCGTLQVDMNLPEAFDIGYIGEDGERHRPVMLHRALFGSLERFIGILIEHYAGKLPLWLAPRQAVVATIVSDADDYAQEVLTKLKAAGLRAEADLRNEKINYKVREHSLKKVPNLLVVGKQEAEKGTVAWRKLGEKQQQFVSLDEAIAMLLEEVTPPDLR